ncbi:cell surface agglutination protein Map4 [Umbelopsis nana]
MPISSTSRVQLSPDSSLKTRRASTPSSTSSTSGISPTGSKIFSQPLPKYEVKSKVGSRDNIRHKPQGGNVKIHNEMPKWNAQAKIPTKAEAAASAKKKGELSPPDAKRRITNTKLDLSKVTSKVGSLDNVRKAPRSGNGDEKSPGTGQMDGPKKATRRISQHIIPDQKLDFSKVTSKVGSKDNIRHKPGGGQTKIFDQKLQWQAEAKIPKPERMSSLTQKLADVSVSDKPRTTRKLEEDAGANPFLTEEPEQLKKVAGAKELLSATQKCHLPHNEEELPALDIDSQDKDIEVS